MKIRLKSCYPFIILLLLSIPLFFLNISDRHGWGDDFAQYIKEALNIANGVPFYQSNYIYNALNPEYSPPQYPPGFPLLLWPVIKLWGVSFIALCYFNTVLLALLLLALYTYFSKHTSTTIAICLSVLICYSQVLLELKKDVLADTPCLLFITLYMSFRNTTDFSWRRIGTLILFAVFAIQCRSQAIFVIAAEGIYLCLRIAGILIRERRIALKNPEIIALSYVIAGTILVNFILDKIIFPTPVSTSAFYNSFFHRAQSWNLKNIANDYTSYLFSKISIFFNYNVHNGYRRAAVAFISGMGLSFVLLGFIINVSRRIRLEEIFFAIICMLIIFYPCRDTRYILPAVPMMFLYFYTTMHLVLQGIKKNRPDISFTLLTVFILGVGFEYFKSAATELTPGTILQERDKVAMKYITTHVSDHDIIVFSKPRMLTLFTNKRCIVTAWQISQERNKKIFDSMQVKYLLLLEGMDNEYFKTYLHEVQHPVDSVVIAQGYTLYSLR